MRKFTYFYSLLLTALFLLPWSGIKAEDLTLTVMDDDYYQYTMPVDGYNLDGAQHNQFLLLSTELTSMNGSNIKGLKFYFDKTGYSWSNTSNIPTVTFRLKVVENTSLSSQITIDGTFTQVYSGAINFDFTNKVWNVTFSTPFAYNGGNLLIDLQTTPAGSTYVKKSGSSMMRFKTKNITGRTMKGSTAFDYCPRTTFTYELAGCTTPTALSASAASSTSASVSWTKGASEEAWQLRYREKTEPESSWSSLIDVTTTPARNLTELATDNTYEVQVRSNCGGDDYSEWSESAEFSLVSCPTVTGVTLTSKLYYGVTVNWATSAPGNCDVRFKEAGDADWTSAGTNIEGDSKAITGLVVGKTYSFQVKPNCSADGWVAAGETYTPAYPAMGTVTVGSITETTASATWADVTGATGYEYVVMPGETAADWTSPTDATSPAALSGLAAGTEYTVYVRAKFGEGRGAEASKSFTTITIAPIALTQDAATTNSITFSWSYAGAATQFQWKSSKAGSDWSSPISVTNAEETGLEAGASYTFYVRAYYSATVQSAALSGSLKTDCGTETLPQTYSSWTAIPNCWYTLRTSDGAYNLPTVYYGELKFYGNNSSSKKTRKAVLVLPKFEKDIQKLQIEVEYQNGGANSNANPQFIVGYVTDPEDVNTFNTISLLDRYYSTSSYTTCDPIDLSGAAENAYIAIAYGNPNSTASSPTDRSAYIKSITVSEKVSCPVPTDLNAVPTADGADVTWTDDNASEWKLQYSIKDADSWTEVTGITATNHTLTGLSTANIYEVQVKAVCGVGDESAWSASAEFQPACLAPINLHTTSLAYNAATVEWTRTAKALRYKTGSNDWTVETISPAANSFNISSLTEQTTYTVQVKAECEDDDIWSDEFEFTTKCAPITIVKGTPFEEGFSSWPSCWEKSEGTYPSASGTLQFYGNTGESYQEVVFPSFTNDIETLTLSFEHKNSYSGTTYGGTLQIGYIKTDGTFVNRETLTPGTSYATYENVITKADAEDVVANYAIRYTATYDYARVYFDNVKVFVSPTCYAPATLSDAASITSEGATFTWTASGHGETQYQYCINEDWSNATITSELTATITGLNPQTNYTFYVRSYCGTDDQSEAISKPLPTGCGTIANTELPWSYGFEDVAAYGEPECWTLLPASYYSAYVVSSNTHEGSRALYVTAGKTDTYTSVVVLPAFEKALKKLNVSFFHKGSNGTIAVGYVTNPADKSTFVQVGEVVTVGSSYQEAVIPFTSLGDVTGNIAFRFKGNTGDGTFYVDDVRVARTEAFADSDNNTAALATLNGQTLDVVIGRTFVQAGYYNTICLPFSLSAEQLAASPIASDDLWAFRYIKVDGDSLYIRIIPSETIEAGVPYLIAWPAGDNIANPLFKNVTISATEGKSVGDSDLKFVGILKPEPFAIGDKKKLFVAANNELYWWNGDHDSQLNSFRAFFYVNSGNGSLFHGMPARIVKDDKIATGVENVQGEGQAIKLLENNQVVIIRNGVKYTIQGQKIQ